MPQNCIVSDKIGKYQLVVKNSLKIIENVFLKICFSTQNKWGMK